MDLGLEKLDVYQFLSKLTPQVKELASVDLFLEVVTLSIISRPEYSTDLFLRPPGVDLVYLGQT